MAVPSIAVRAVSFILTSALVWFAYPVLVLALSDLAARLITRRLAVRPQSRPSIG